MSSVDDILEASRFDDTADQACAAVAEMVKAILTGREVTADPAPMLARLQTSLAGSMREMMHKAIADGTSEEDRRAIVAFLESEPGRKWRGIGPGLQAIGRKVGEDAFNAIALPWLEENVR